MAESQIWDPLPQVILHASKGRKKARDSGEVTLGSGKSLTPVVEGSQLTRGRLSDFTVLSHPLDQLLGTSDGLAVAPNLGHGSALLRGRA